MRFEKILFVFLLALVLSASSVFGQVTGTVSGLVEDGTGAGVPNAKVSLLLAGGKTAVAATQTGVDGRFNIQAVRAESYDLKVEATGFLTAMARIRVETARETSVPALKLELASTTQTVEVLDTATLVQVASADVTQTISKQQIEALPVFDRQISTLYITQPGVSNSRTTTSVNGLRASYTNVLLDGVNIQDSVRTNALDYMPGKLTVGQIEEMTLSLSNTETTIGGNANTITLVTPSGTNDLHGSAYWFNRNSWFGANNWFSNKNGVERPFRNLNQVGGVLRGPIVKDKLLFFANYEAYRDKANAIKNTTILTPEARQGNFRYLSGGALQTFNILNAQRVAIDPFIQKELDMMPSVGNNTSIGDGRNTTGYSFNARNNETRDNLVGKIDYYRSTTQHFAGTYMWNRDILDRPDSGTFFTVIPPVYNDNSSQFGSLSWRWNPSPTFTNEARAGFDRQPGTFKNSQPDPKYFIANASVTFTSPINETRPEGRHTNSYSFQDNANWIKGKHALSFGFQAALWRVDFYGYTGTIPTYSVGFAPNSPYGFNAGVIPGASTTDTSVANNLLATLGGIVVSGTQTFNAANRTSGFVSGAPAFQNFDMNNLAPYISDKWKIRKGLTLTMGLRWEYFGPVEEKDGLFIQPRADDGNAVAALLGNATLDFAGSAVGRPLYKRDLNNFAPYLGFAWDPFGNGKTSIRGAYSLAYSIDNTINDIYISGTATNGLFSTRSLGSLNAIVSQNLPTIAAPAFGIPTTSKAQFDFSPNSPPVQSIVDPNLATPYVQQWSLSLQREVKGFVLEGRYVGNHAPNMFRQIDFNQINIRQDTYLEDFIKARNNGFLALKANNVFDPRYNTNISGSQPLPFFDKLPSGGSLTSTTVTTPLRNGEAGTLAQVYQTNLYFPRAGFSYFPNPYTLYSAFLTNFSHSTYNSMQLEARKSTRGGLFLSANYTFSKALSDALAVRSLEAVLDNANPGIEKARAPFDVTHSIKFMHSYPLPFGKSKRFHFNNAVMNGITGDWSLSGFLHLDSGPPVSVLSALGTLNRGARSSNNTVDTNATLQQLRDVSGQIMTGNGPYFFDPSLSGTDGRGVAPQGTAPFAGQMFFFPQPGSVGSLQRRSLSGPWYEMYSLGIRKELVMTERHKIEIRADIYNLFNHANFFAGDQTVTSANFGKMTSTLSSGEGVGSRSMQFGLMYKF